MSEDFTGQKIKLTYQSLLHLDPAGSGISVNFEQVYDGDGTASALFVSSTSIKVGSVVLSGQYIQLEDSGLDYVRIASPTNVTSSYTVTMPTAGPAGANYILESDAGGNLSWIATPGGGTPAPVDAQYVTLALNGTLTNERVLTAGSNISLTDAGAGSTVTVAVTGIGTSIQGYDATLAAFAAYNTNGLLTQTAADTFTGRTLTAPAAGITITDGDGVLGNPTLVLANDLSALEGLGATGLAARTGADTWAQRTITGTAAEITVADGSGVSGNPTLSLPAALTFTGKTVTGGTFTTPTINVNDADLSIRDNGDTTKILKFEASGISAATTRTLTAPDANGTIALTTNLPNTFGTISVAGQSDVVADSTSDTLTLVAGTSITITTNAATDTITINSTGGGGGTAIGLVYSLANTAFI